MGPEQQIDATDPQSSLVREWDLTDPDDMGVMANLLGRVIEARLNGKPLHSNDTRFVGLAVLYDVSSMGRLFNAVMPLDLLEQLEEEDRLPSREYWDKWTEEWVDPGPSHGIVGRAALHALELRAGEQIQPVNEATVAPGLAGRIFHPLRHILPPWGGTTR